MYRPILVNHSTCASWRGPLVNILCVVQRGRAGKNGGAVIALFESNPPDPNMSRAHSRTLIIAAALLAGGCRSDTKEESPGEVLARDTALAADLRIASDTSAYREAADVAMATEPDSLPTGYAVPQPAPRVAAPVEEATRRPSSPTPPPVPRGTSLPRPAARVAEGRTPPPRSSPMPAAARIPDLRKSAPPRAPKPVVNTAAPNDPSVACGSPGMAEQRRCLMLYLSRSDVRLDRNYQELIAALKREAGTGPGEKEPDSVERLRAAQRAWLVYRDTECRRRNRGKEGPLWAPVRGGCLAEFADYRAEELAQTLARLSPE